MKFQRRSVLKALGAFASLPLGKLLESSIAQAQTASVPLKFIGLYHPHGVAMGPYGSQAGETETTFDLTFADSALTPFDSPSASGGLSFKKRLIVFEGVDDVVAEMSSTPGHGAASCLFTDSTTTGNDHTAQCESLDYYLGRTKGLGADTRFPTLNLGVGSPGDGGADAIAHGAGGAAIRNLIDPVAVFDMIFAGLTGATDASAAKARAQNQSVLDFLKGDLSSLQARLGPNEKLKLTQHLDSLRELERRVTAAVTHGTCEVPSRPVPSGNTDASLNFPKLLKWNGGEPYFDRIADVQIDLLAQAIGCGLTRFATFLLDDPGRALSIDGVTLAADVHNTVAHTYSAMNPSSIQRLGRLNRYYYGKVARLMQRLEEHGALASTLIMVGSDLGDPSLHSTRGIPLLLAGGDGNKLVGPTGRTLTFGRRLKAHDDCPANNPWCSSPELVLTAHNHVLVSICNLFGVTTNAFGAFDPQYTTQTGSDGKTFTVNPTDIIGGEYPGLLA